MYTQMRRGEKIDKTSTLIYDKHMQERIQLSLKALYHTKSYSLFKIFGEMFQAFFFKRIR